MKAKAKTPQCRVCETNASKYTCPVCSVLYCSVQCFKDHKNNSCVSVPESQTLPLPAEDEQDQVPLKPLTALNWPYVPEQPLYVDPLKRDDPKAVTLQQYEAIATSPAVRTALANNPGLREQLKTIDRLRGTAREDALQRALAVDASQLKDHTGQNQVAEDVQAMRKLAEAIEAAIRGDDTEALGLNWSNS